MRETGDASFYNRADGVLRRALEIEPADPGALTQRGALELSRHDFRAGLRDALLARRLAPQVDAPFGVLVDAAGRARPLRRRRPCPAGDGRSQARSRRVRARVVLPRAARRSGRRARRAGARAERGRRRAENVAYVDTLLSHLDLLRGRLALAAREAREALARFPGYPAAGAALARVQVARGDLRGAIARLRGVVARLPLPEYVVLLGEAEQAAGRPRAARRDFALVARRAAAARARPA